NDALAVREMRQQSPEELPDRVELGVEMFIDGCTDDDHDKPSLADQRRIIPDVERSPDDLAELRFGALLEEGHPPRTHRSDSPVVNVMDPDLESPLRERDGQRQADVATSPNDANVIFETLHRSNSASSEGLGRGESRHGSHSTESRSRLGARDGTSVAGRTVGGARVRDPSAIQIIQHDPIRKSY